MGKNVHATGEGNLSALMISIISTGALPVHSRGSRSAPEKGEEAEGSELGGGGGVPKALAPPGPGELVTRSRVI